MSSATNQPPSTRSRNPAKRAAAQEQALRDKQRKRAQRTATPASAPERTDATRDPRALVRRATAWALAALAAILHVAAISEAAATSLLAVVVVAPAFLTATFLPEVRWRGWHRWLGLWALILIALPQWFHLSFVIAETWVLHRFWVVERTRPISVPLASRLSRRPKEARP